MTDAQAMMTATFAALARPPAAPPVPMVDCLACDGTGRTATDLSECSTADRRRIVAQWDRDYWDCGVGDPGQECAACQGTGKQPARCDACGGPAELCFDHQWHMWTCWGCWLDSTMPCGAGCAEPELED